MSGTELAAGLVPSSSPEAGGTRPTPVAPFAVQAGEGTALETPIGDVITLKAATRQTNGSLTVLELVIGPKKGSALHTHLREDELWYVIDGDFRFKAGGRVRRAARPGRSGGSDRRGPGQRDRIHRPAARGVRSALTAKALPRSEEAGELGAAAYRNRADSYALRGVRGCPSLSRWPHPGGAGCRSKLVQADPGPLSADASALSAWTLRDPGVPRQVGPRGPHARRVRDGLTVAYEAPLPGFCSCRFAMTT